MSESEELIEAWRQRLAVITSNLNDLSDAEHTKRIRIRVREGHYSGATKDKAIEAVNELSGLLGDYVLLARALDEAIQVQKAGLFSSRESKLEKVQAILEGPSIHRSATRIPLAKRGLLGVSEQVVAVTPGELLAEMQSAFVASRDALYEIDKAETEGAGELSALRNDYQTMARRAEALKCSSDPPSFIELQDLQTDPLNAAAGIESLRRALQSWSNHLGVLERSRVNAKSAVENARATVNELFHLNQALTDDINALRELQGEASVVAHRFNHQGQLEMLASWCETLESNEQAGQWDAVNIGSSRIKIALDEAYRQCHQHIADVKGKLAEFDELQGRFAALKVKDRTMRSRGQVDAARQQLKERIEAAFADRPVLMDQLRVLLQQYQTDMLNSGQR